MIEINGKEYRLKYTLESWKKLKTECKVTPQNVDEKSKEDPAKLLADLIYYGLLPADREKVTMDQIESSVGFEAMEFVMKAIQETMPAIVGSKEAADGEVDDPAKKK